MTPVNHYVSLVVDIVITDNVNVFITSIDTISVKLSQILFSFNRQREVFMQVKLGFSSLKTSTTNTMKVYHYKEQLLFKSLC